MPKFQKFKCDIFGVFDYLLSTQNVNVARFARNVENVLNFLGHPVEVTRIGAKTDTVG